MTGQFNRKQIRPLAIGEQAGLQHERAHGTGIEQEGNSNSLSPALTTDDLTILKGNVATLCQIIRADQVGVDQRPSAGRAMLVKNCESKHALRRLSFSDSGA